MINETITQSKSVESAVFQGALALGLTPEEVEYQVLEEPKKGFLSIGSKMAKVLVYRKGYVPGTDAKKAAQAAEKKAAQAAQAAKASQAAKTAAPTEKKEAAPTEKKPVAKAQEGAPKKEAAPAPKKAATEAAPAAPKQPVDAAIAEAHPSVALLKRLMDNLGIHATLTLCEAQGEQECSHIDIEGTDEPAEVGVGALIGHHGDTLDAVQYLANLAANRAANEEYPKVKVDVEGYRARREETLCRLATRTAHKAVKYHRNFTLEPMNPYERRIIHAHLQGFEGVSTHSVGSGAGRRVVVVYESAASME